MPTIYLVMRNSEEVAPLDMPQMGFVDPQLADQHAAQVATATGIAHVVVPVRVTKTLPQSRTWHSMCVEVDLDGTEMWRHEDRLVSFTGHPDERTEASWSWRLIVRSTPSQPPSRVRVELVGPDREWCINAARACWAGASASDQFTEAVAIEQLFSAQPRR